MAEQMRIGEALVACGAISEADLIEALRAQKDSAGLPLGAVVAERCGVPVEKVDETNVHAVLLPRFRKLLLARLLTISRGDKFAKDMDVRTYVIGIITVVEAFEVRVFDLRKYVADGSGFVRQGDERGFETSMEIRVVLKTSGGGEVGGRISVRHDSRTDELVITDDEKHIKESIYYGLRTQFRAGT